MPDLTKLDLSTESLNLLLPQFKNATKIKAIIEGSTAYLDASILEIDKLLKALHFDSLTGDLLDNIGKLLNVKREGRSDEDFKVAIQTRIFINSSGGNAKSIFSILDRIVGEGKYVVTENFPAEVQVRLYVNQSILTSEVISDLLPIGVKGVFLQNPYADKVVWELSDTNPDGSIPNPNPLSVLPDQVDAATSNVTLIDIIFT